MTKGRVIKNYNGYYYVDVGRENLVECRRRGKLLKAKILVGDELEITELGQDKGVIEALLPRRNQIRRPAVANIDQLLVIMAAQSPDPNRFLVDKMLMTCEYGGIHPTLCFNKCDLDRDTAEAYKAFYERCGYDVYLVSAKTGEGLDTLRALLPHRMTAFAGPSGVGKSSLLSQLLGRKDLSVGAVSEKIKRGRHTTRVAELLPFAGGYIVDTPGFSSMELDGIDKLLLPSYFPEFRPYLGHCRFSPCSHSHEPDCAVKDAVAAGSIPQERYDAYLSILEEIHANQKKY